MYHKRIKSEGKKINDYVSETKLKRIKELSSRFGTDPTLINFDDQIVYFKIKVCVRARPINFKQSDIKVIKVESSTNVLIEQKEKKNKSYSFTFDRIFKETESNVEIHETICKQLIQSFTKGYNSSIFAYGATGSGKTYTMFGNETHLGLVHYAIRQLFQEIEKYIEDSDFIIKMSGIELYNQNLYDLLSDTLNPIQLRECPNKGIFLAGATEHMISTEKQVNKLIKRVISRRNTAATSSNQSSSRSHAIIQIHLERKDKGQGIYQQINYSKLSLIDLAGSEKSGTSLNTYESKKINQSLLVLGTCIHQLSRNCERGSKNHIPYRDSKLTRLLKDSLGGNTKTVMISTISSSISCYDETYNTLVYSSHANKIELKIHKNIKKIDKSHVANYEKIIFDLKEENEKMKQKLGSEYDSKPFEKYKKLLDKGFENQLHIRRQLLQIERKIESIEFDKYKTLYMNSKFEKMYQPKQNTQYQKFLKEKAKLAEQYTKIKEQRYQILKKIKSSGGNSINGDFLNEINQKILNFEIKQLNIQKIQKSKKTTALETQKIQVNLLIEQLKHREKIISQHKNVLKEKQTKNKDQWIFSFLDNTSVKSPISVLPKIQFRTQQQHCDTQPTQSLTQPLYKIQKSVGNKQYRNRSKSIRQKQGSRDQNQHISKNQFSEFLSKNINRYKSYGKKKY